MKELIVISGKGGTGKTSVLAAFASLAENKVLCDADVDAADLHLIMAPDIKQHTMEVQETEDKVGKAYLEQAEERLAQDDVADANADDELEREEAEAAEMEDENDYSQEDNMAKFLRDLGEGGDEPPRDPRPEDGDAPSEEAEEEDGEVEAAAGANYAARASAKFTLGEEIQYEGPGDTLISAKFERDGAFDDEIIVTVGGKKAVIQRLSVLTPEEVDA